MTQCSADGEPGFVVDRALLGREGLRRRSTRRGCFPSGQFEITCLRIRVPMAVHPMDARSLALMLEATQLLDVLLVGRNEAAAAGDVSEVPAVGLDEPLEGLDSGNRLTQAVTWRERRGNQGGPKSL